MGHQCSPCISQTIPPVAPAERLIQSLATLCLRTKHRLSQTLPPCLDIACALGRTTDRFTENTTYHPPCLDQRLFAMTLYCHYISFFLPICFNFCYFRVCLTTKDFASNLPLILPLSFASNFCLDCLASLTPKGMVHPQACSFLVISFNVETVLLL